MDLAEKFFKREKITVSKEVLKRLMESLPKSANVGAACFELWKDSDMRTLVKSGSSSVLSTLSSKTKTTTIAEPLVLQIDSMRDISKPAYQQLQKVVNRFGENVLVSGDADANDKKAKGETGNRVLLLELTDGIHNIKAMEYSSIPQISVDTPPGTKIRLIPPVQCRKGMLLLKGSSISVIGGKVPELCERFSQKQVLATKLKGKDKDTLLSELEKAAPPCPPPNQNTADVGRVDQLSQRVPDQRGQKRPAVQAPSHLDDFHFDADGDAFLAQVPLDGLMDVDDDDLLSKALDDFESGSRR